MQRKIPTTTMAQTIPPANHGKPAATSCSSILENIKNSQNMFILIDPPEGLKRPNDLARFLQIVFKPSDPEIYIGHPVFSIGNPTSSI